MTTDRLILYVFIEKKRPKLLVQSINWTCRSSHSCIKGRVLLRTWTMQTTLALKHGHVTEIDLKSGLQLCRLNKAQHQHFLQGLWHYSCVNKSFGHGLFDCCYCEEWNVCIEMGELEMILVWFAIILKLNLNEVKMRGFDTGQMYTGWEGWVTKLNLIYRKNNIDGVGCGGCGRAQGPCGVHYKAENFERGVQKMWRKK